MKKINFIFFALMAIVFSACEQDYIDAVKSVDAGSDESAPTITITSPTQDGEIKIAESAEMPIFFEAEDDIELDAVSILIDGVEADAVSGFTDYRRYAPPNGHMLDMEAGAHTLQIIATDKTGKSASSEVVDFTLIKMDDFVSVYGETFYMSFDNHYLNHASLESAVVTGSPGFEQSGKVGAAYQGAESSNLAFPVDDVFTGTEISATFWYNIAQQGRSGILSASPTGSNNNRVAGFRLFREGGDDAQIIKLNVGNGTADSWFDGGAAATVNPLTTDWVHVAITISSTQATVYIDGEVVAQGDLTAPMSFDNCEDLYIASGGPYFSGWGHGDDLSQYDELRIFNTAISQSEVQAIMAAEE